VTDFRALWPLWFNNRMDEEQPNFKVTDRRLFNADGSPRDVPPDEKPAPAPVVAEAAAPAAEPAPGPEPQVEPEPPAAAAAASETEPEAEVEFSEE